MRNLKLLMDKLVFDSQKLNKSIPYIISKGLNLDDVIELNSTIKTWKIGDFIRKYSMDGMNEYKTTVYCKEV